MPSSSSGRSAAQRRRPPRRGPPSTLPTCPRWPSSRVAPPPKGSAWAMPARSSRAAPARPRRRSRPSRRLASWWPAPPPSSRRSSATPAIGAEPRQDGPPGHPVPVRRRAMGDPADPDRRGRGRGMSTRMELVAGHAQDILVVVGTDERHAFAQPDRFHAYLSLSGGMDPTWLDLFADAARVATSQDRPIDFLDARTELEGPEAADSSLVVERVDPAWITAVARLPDAILDRLAGRWVDRLEDEFGPISSEEKPWIRDLARQLVAFCRRADAAPDVL